MKKSMKAYKNFAIVAAFLFATSASAQIYKTSTGVVKFHSHTNMEDIDGTNSQVSAACDAKSGAVEISMGVNNFQFKKALMQKHFQENYLETGKFPKSTFKGVITNNSTVTYTKDGTYAVTVKGKLTMHGVTKDVTIPGKLVISGGKVNLKANFKVKPEDYGIKIPANNAASIAKEIEITVDCALAKK
jgi:polyisoprenoid-binding protein YceI